jgi:hypothetical protein
MGNDYEEIKKNCGCLIMKWNDDQGRSGQYVKHYCNNCQEEKKQITEIYQNNYNKLNDEYKIKPSNILFEEIIELQINQLKNDINEKCCTFNSHEIYCPCCDKMLQFNNFKRHKNSLAHIKNLRTKK